MGKKNDKIISLFLGVIKENIVPCKVILFGSRAKRTAKKKSDYDFLLISPQFKKWEWEERAARVYHLKRNIPAAMDIICLTPHEFERKKRQHNVIRDAAGEGILLT